MHHAVLLGLCGFAKVGIKGGENILECLKILHARFVYQTDIQIYDQIEILRNC